VYFLIDEKSAGDSVIGDVIRLVRGDSLAEIATSVRALLAYPNASEGLKMEVCSIAGERAAIHGSNLEAIMEDTAKEQISPELTPEEKRSVFEMFRTIYMTLKDTPEVRRMDEARSAARRQGLEDGLEEGRKKGRQEGRQEGRREGRSDAMRALLVKACERDGSAQPELMQMIANANAVRLETWVDRWIAGEKLEKFLGEEGP